MNRCSEQNKKLDYGEEQEGEEEEKIRGRAKSKETRKKSKRWCFCTFPTERWIKSQHSTYCIEEEDEVNGVDIEEEEEGEDKRKEK